MSTDVTRWTSKDGKYKIIMETGDGQFRFEAFRHGRPWRSLAGDNLVLALFQELTELAKETKV